MAKATGFDKKSRIRYHIQPELVLDVLSDQPKMKAAVQQLIDNERLGSLEDFLNDLRR